MVFLVLFLSRMISLFMFLIIVRTFFGAATSSYLYRRVTLFVCVLLFCLVYFYWDIDLSSSAVSCEGNPKQAARMWRIVEAGLFVGTTLAAFSVIYRNTTLTYRVISKLDAMAEPFGRGGPKCTVPEHPARIAELEQENTQLLEDNEAKAKTIYQLESDIYDATNERDTAVKVAEALKVEVDVQRRMHGAPWPTADVDAQLEEARSYGERTSASRHHMSLDDFTIPSNEGFGFFDTDHTFTFVVEFLFDRVPYLLFLYLFFILRMGIIWLHARSVRVLIFYGTLCFLGGSFFAFFFFFNMMDAALAFTTPTVYMFFPVFMSNIKVNLKEYLNIIKTNRLFFFKALLRGFAVGLIVGGVLLNLALIYLIHILLPSTQELVIAVEDIIRSLEKTAEGNYSLQFSEEQREAVLRSLDNLQDIKKKLPHEK